MLSPGILSEETYDHRRKEIDDRNLIKILKKFNITDIRSVSKTDTMRMVL